MMLRVPALLLGLAVLCHADEGKTIVDASFKDRKEMMSWTSRPGSVWKLDEDQGLYQLTAPGKPGKHRRPLSWSVWKGEKVGAFTATVRARCLTPTKVKGRDVLIIFGFQDPDHYYYVHFSAENSKVHNIFAKVDGGERTPLPLIGERHPRLLGEGFHELQLTHDPESGRIDAMVDGKPVLSAVDKTFRDGWVGVGSFDDSVDFDRFVLEGSPAR